MTGTWGGRARRSHSRLLRGHKGGRPPVTRVGFPEAAPPAHQPQLTRAPSQGVGARGRVPSEPRPQVLRASEASAWPPSHRPHPDWAPWASASFLPRPFSLVTWGPHRTPAPAGLPGSSCASCKNGSCHHLRHAGEEVEGRGLSQREPSRSLNPSTPSGARAGAHWAPGPCGRFWADIAAPQHGDLGLGRPVTNPRPPVDWVGAVTLCR